MKRLLNFLICKLRPFFAKRNLSITQKLDSAPGNLYLVSTVEPETQPKRNVEEDKKRIIELQESARNSAIRNIQALSSVLVAHENSAIKIIVSGNRADVLRPVQAKFSEDFAESDRLPSNIDEALYWETNSGRF